MAIRTDINNNRGGNVPYLIETRDKNDKHFSLKPNAKILDKRGQIYLIKYPNSKGVYKYLTRNVRIHNFEQSLTNCKVLIQERPFECEKIDYYDKYAIVAISGQTERILLSKDIYPIPKESCHKQSADIVAYLREIIEKETPNTFIFPKEESGNASFSRSATINTATTLKDLSLKEFDMINTDDKKRILYHYLRGKYPTKTSTIDKDEVIFPFGCNESQKEATIKALQNRITIIEGPPGTGKTQTILNIIANLISKGKSTAVASNNNAAVENICQKLDKYGYSKVYALLGNSDNKTEFFENGQDKELKKVECLSQDIKSEYRKRIKVLNKDLEKSFRESNKLAKNKEFLQSIKNEYRHICSEQAITDEIQEKLLRHFRKSLSSEKIKKARMLLEQQPQGVLSKLWKTLRLNISYGIIKSNKIDYKSDSFNFLMNQMSYRAKAEEIKIEIDKSENFLETSNYRELLSKHTELSKKLFDNTLYERYKNRENNRYTISNYKVRFDEFAQDYPVILSTTSSLARTLSRQRPIDYLIIDESSQVDIASAAICFSLCKNVVIVGDSMQLTHIVSDSDETGRIYQKFNIPEAYDYTRFNILTSLKHLYGKDLPVVLLKEHYRCHPEIIHFCNKKFYNDQLVIMTDGEGSPLTLISTRDGDLTNNINERQADATVSYIIDHYMDNPAEAGVIAPYRNQVELLKKKLSTISPMIEADTIHKFQGREKDHIIYNLVTSKENTFTDNANLINVAVSRAVKSFAIFVPQNMPITHGSNIGDLIRYIKYHTPSEKVLKNTRYNSIFDILYNKMFDEECEKKYQDIEGSKAEKLFHDFLVNEILPAHTKFANINFIREYKLRDLVCDINQFEEREIRFMRNNARIDFLLYNRIDNSPLLAIEVDGISFHRNEKQEERDRVKDRILQKIGIACLRLATDGYAEKDKVVSKLKEVMMINN